VLRAGVLFVNVRNVLFLCTGNSARSILAEALLNHRGAGLFQGFSAGSFPKGAVHPLALKALHAHRLPVDGLRSKSWNEFAGPEAPKMDFVFTEGTDDAKRRAFEDAFRELDDRITRFVALSQTKDVSQ
jgi:protein-tyrosine-phosphatase